MYLNIFKHDCGVFKEQILTVLYLLYDNVMLSLQAGALWHLFLFLFKYDYTLDESGVDASDETNQQVCIMSSCDIT